MHTKNNLERNFKHILFKSHLGSSTQRVYRKYPLENSQHGVSRRDRFPQIPYPTKHIGV